MKLEILMAAMHQTDLSLVEKSNLQSPVLVINQADREEEIEEGQVRMVTTTERGTSKSRNLALREAKGEICLFADDDEWFIDGLEEKILAAYKELPEADVIIFDVGDSRGFGDDKKELRRLNALRVGTPRISFRRASVVGQVAFDELLGPGTATKSTEDVKFLLDCFDAGLRVFYFPLYIADLKDSESSWFAGYTPEMFYNRGRLNRYLLGLPLGMLYGFWWLLARRNHYQNEMGYLQALAYWLKGIATTDLRKEFNG